MTKNTRNINLTWVYPPNNWVSNYQETFIYGWSNPKAKLFVSVETSHATSLQRPIKIFSNGNFAQKIKLPYKKSTIRLIQNLNGKKKIFSRNIIVVKRKTKQSKQVMSLRGAQRPASPAKRGERSNLTNFFTSGRLLRSKALAMTLRNSFRNDVSIVIDPGHGGKEHGTHSPKGIPEKVFNLQISKLLYKKLKKKFKQVYLTRTKDKFVSLKERVNFAKKKKCNLLISIHHNALPDNENPLKHRGIGIYYTHAFVKSLAKKLLDGISKSSGLKKYGIFKRNFAVTRPDFYLGVLIECGFLIHPQEAEIITKRQTQEKIVNGISSALNNL
ncbi:MAG: N-acetylmuramoyl-L-alanine amidase [Candidatus Melainabacteria bacterium]|nr:N-acetylmuramoyl-L-alanine amidase [Candidatus Melainabacteria bacterium]